MTFLEREGVTEVDGPGYKDGRAFWVTVVDPFDLWGLVKGRERERFWEVMPDGKVGGKGGGARGDVEANV
jgi:hypothetical protein